MQRITITIDDDLLGTLDTLCRRRRYTSRSEALRDLVRQAQVREQTTHDGRSRCFATLSYVYEHGTRDLAKRITSSQHDRHHLSVATMHVHLDLQHCLEVAVLHGSVGEVQTLADSITSQRGVRHGNLQILPAAHGPPHHHHAKSPRRR